ncbi:MFS transporter [Sinosporangium siamense]|uniref:Quaternary ammonium compound efflux MFS transporter QacA n=1 Tax=Sinosporangium siamense TaxID=1367973 RepID=A0A919RER9_9ACTN|nr:MFS transporter [Sinosporangium siamense]GII92362.1 quaternary ammonium compound efflux MFS transporter QacA [Sinosporangium siamense]
MAVHSTRRPERSTPAPHPKRWAALAVLSSSLLLIVMDITILNVALPALSADLRPTSVELLWILDAYSLVLSGLLVTASALGDRWGRKKALLLGFAVFGLVSAGVLLATTSAHVVLLRALLGIGGALIMPSTLSMIRVLFTDPRERATALGVWATMASLGGALGPVLGGLLLEYFSWQSAFLINVPIMLIAIAAGLILLPESRNPSPGRWDALGTVLSIVGMTALVYAIKQFGKHGVTDPVALVCLAAAAGTLGWFVVRSLRRPDPLLEFRLFKGKAFSAGTLTALTTSISMAAIMLLLAQWMQLVGGYGPLETGIRLLPIAISSGIVSPLAPRLAEIFGARTVLAGGLATTGLGYFMFYAWPSPVGYATVAVALLLIGAGMGSLAVASAVIMAGAPPEKAGSAAAIEETSYELGATFGIAVLGSVAAVMYRAELPRADLIAQGLPGPAADAARESLAGALEAVKSLGASAAPIVREVQAAFTSSLALFGAVGGALMLAATVAVWLLTPRDLDLSDSHH